MKTHIELLLGLRRRRAKSYNAKEDSRSSLWLRILFSWRCLVRRIIYILTLFKHAGSACHSGNVYATKNVSNVETKHKTHLVYLSSLQVPLLETSAYFELRNYFIVWLNGKVGNRFQARLRLRLIFGSNITTAAARMPQGYRQMTSHYVYANTTMTSSLPELSTIEKYTLRLMNWPAYSVGVLPSSLAWKFQTSAPGPR